MAKKLRDEDLVLNIIINGNKSKKEMNELERAITATNREIKGLEKTQATMVSEGKKETEAYKAVTTAIKDKNAAIVLAESRLTSLRKGQKLTEMTSVDLGKEIKRLTGLMNLSVQGTDNWKAYKKELDGLKARFAEVKDASKATSENVEEMDSAVVDSVSGFVASAVSVGALVSGLMSLNETYTEFTDMISDVQKTTGETEATVRDLNEEFKKIDTRTQQDDLLGLAEVAGKLGIEGKNDILGFVRAADQIGVALTEDLGGDIEKSINEIGKIIEVFDMRSEFGIEKSLLKVGSIINDLGASSSANEGFIVGLTQHVAGVAKEAGFTIDQVMGLASTFDQLGYEVEVSGTAFNNIVPAMFKDTATFARIAGVGVTEFTDLLKTDVNGAFVKVLQGVKGNNAAFGDMVGRLDELGVDGSRAVSVITSLSAKVGLLKVEQDKASASLKAGTSITNEYNIKNNNAAANLDKTRKEIYNMKVELGEKLNPVMTNSTSLLVMLAKILSVVLSFLVDNRAAIFSLVVGYTAYNLVLFTTNLLKTTENGLTRIGNALKITENFLIKALQGSVILLAGAKALLTGNITRAAAAMRMFNLVVGANPIAILISILATAVTAWALYGDELTAVQKAQQSLIDVEVEAQKSMSATKIEIEGLLAVARDKTRSDNERAEAIRKLNALSPEYLGFLNLENINTDKANSATKNYIESLLKVARVKAATARLQALEDKKIELNLKGSNTTWFQKVMSSARGAFSGYGAAAASELRYASENFMDEYKDIEAETKSIMDYIGRNEPKPGSKGDDAGGGAGDTLTGDQIKAREKYAKDAKSQLDQEKLAHNDRLREVGLFGKQRKDMTQADLQVLKDLEKIHNDNIAAINKKSNKAALSLQNKEEKEAERIAKSQKEYQLEVLKSQKTEIEQETMSHFERLAKAGVQGVKLNDQQLKTKLALEKIYRSNLDKLDAEAITKELDKNEKKYTKELRELKIKNSEELASVKTLEQAKSLLKNNLSTKELVKIKSLADAKKALLEKYAEDEKALTAKQLEGLTAELRKAIDSGDLEGVKLSDHVFSEEELKILSERLDIAREKLAELLGSAKEKGSTDDPDKPEEYSFKSGKTDVLGMSVDDWKVFHTHIQNGVYGVGEMAMAVQALATAWSTYSSYVAAGEKKQLQEFELATKTKKEKLESQLSAGKISQKRYTDEVARLDLELDAKKAEIELKQAKREKAIQIMSGIAGTASAVVGALGMKPWTPFNFAMAAVVGAMGAAQIATIMATPLPGKEEGGYLDVTRAQDNKKFRAKNAGNKRGYIGATSVLVSEAGTEFVAAAEAVRNPTVKPVLDIIDSAQRNGTINTLNLEKLFSGRKPIMKGRKTGGYLNDDVRMPGNSAGGSSTDPALLEMLANNLLVQQKLIERLSGPIKADVSLLGRKGLIEKMAEYNQIVDNSNL